MTLSCEQFSQTFQRLDAKSDCPVPAAGAPNRDIPASGAISFSTFRGSARMAIVDYEIIGGGGGGGHGVGDGTASGRAVSGGATAITSEGKQLVSAAGGLGA